MQISALTCASGDSTPIRVTGIDVRVASERELEVHDKTYCDQGVRPAQWALQRWCEMQAEGAFGDAAELALTRELQTFDMANMRCTADSPPVAYTMAHGDFACPHIVQQCCRSVVRDRPGFEKQITHHTEECGTPLDAAGFPVSTPIVPAEGWTTRDA